MFRILCKYFIIKRRLPLPGIGLLTCKYQPASLDFTRKAFVAPYESIEFVAGDPAIDDNFYFFVSAEQGIDVSVAKEQFDAFTRKLLAKLQADGNVDLPGLGVFSRRGKGLAQFTSNLSMPEFLPDVSIDTAYTPVEPETPRIGQEQGPQVMTGNANGEFGAEVQKRDYWWIYAIIIALLSIAAIVYYYSVNGSLN